MLRPSIALLTAAQGLSGVHVMMSPMVVDGRLRASHSGAGTGITSGTFPPATAVGMVASRPKRRASIQRVPCSHKREYRRSYKSPAMNSASVEATVSVVGGSKPEF